MQPNAHEVVHDVVAGGDAAEDIADQLALLVFAHLLEPEAGGVGVEERRGAGGGGREKRRREEVAAAEAGRG